MSRQETLFDHRYLLHEALGRGGMGIVFWATDRLTGEPVALRRVFRLTEELTFRIAPGRGTNDFEAALATKCTHITRMD